MLTAAAHNMWYNPMWSSFPIDAAWSPLASSRIVTTHPSTNRQLVRSHRRSEVEGGRVVFAPNESSSPRTGASRTIERRSRRHHSLSSRRNIETGAFSFLVSIFCSTALNHACIQ